MPETQNIPLWKQLLGAATGAMVALLLYGGFVVVSPNFSLLTAYLSSTFEGADRRSPRTIRTDAHAREVAMEERARAATDQLRRGEKYSPPSTSSSLGISVPLTSSSSAVSVPLGVKKEVKNQQQKGAGVPEETGAPPPPTKKSHRSKQRGEKHADQKHKEKKLPNTGVPLWAIGSVALCLTMSLRYRKEFCGVLQRNGS